MWLFGMIPRDFCGVRYDVLLKETFLPSVCIYIYTLRIEAITL